MSSLRFSPIGAWPRSCAPLAMLLLFIAIGCSKPAPEPETEAAPEPAEVVVQPPPGPKPLWQQHIEELQPEVDDWARAWSNQDVDAYLSHYSPDFVPPNGLSRAAWETQRRQRLTRPASIAIEISNFRRVGYSKGSTGDREIELVKVQFQQRYESDTFADEVDKELQLELVDLTWKIVTETSL